MNDLQLAQAIFLSDLPTFALVRGGCELARGAQSGVRELAVTLQALGAVANGASLADKVIGKAVALMAADAGIVSIYTPLISEPALRVCGLHDIACHYDRQVSRIKNARGDDLCPIEQLVIHIDDPTLALTTLRAKLQL
jgi:hypothetical protein